MWVWDCVSVLSLRSSTLYQDIDNVLVSSLNQFSQLPSCLRFRCLFSQTMFDCSSSVYEAGQILIRTCYHRAIIALRSTLTQPPFSVFSIQTWGDLVLYCLACCLSVCVFQYLQKGVHSPLCLSQNAALVQGNAILLAASSRSWTPEAWAPEGVSSWLDSGSSNTHNGMLRGGGGDRKREGKSKQESELEGEIV